MRTKCPSCQEPLGPEDRNRCPSCSRFLPGNAAARRQGLYQRANLTPDERRRVGRVRKYLKGGGLPDDVAASLGVLWANAVRVIDAYSRLETDEDRFHHFPTFERAGQMVMHVLRRRDRAAGEESVPSVPLWQQYERRAGGED